MTKINTYYFVFESFLHKIRIIEDTPGAKIDLWYV